jgi:hypothetical protein
MQLRKAYHARVPLHMTSGSLDKPATPFVVNPQVFSNFARLVISQFCEACKRSPTQRSKKQQEVLS